MKATGISTLALVALLIDAGCQGRSIMPTEATAPASSQIVIVNDTVCKHWPKGATLLIDMPGVRAYEDRPAENEAGFKSVKLAPGKTYAAPFQATGKGEPEVHVRALVDGEHVASADIKMVHDLTSPWVVTIADFPYYRQ